MLARTLTTVCATLAAGLQALPADAVVDPDLPRQADLMVLGIVLDHTESSQNAFGLKLEPEDPDAMRPRMTLCNHDRREKLTLDFYERDTAVVISELHVERVSTPHVECVVPPQHIENFDSGKGIHLGMRQEEVTAILGTHYQTHRHPDEEVISYRIDEKDVPMLQRHNAPAYYGQYHFRDNRLVKYGMGFEFP